MEGRSFLYSRVGKAAAALGPLEANTDGIWASEGWHLPGWGLVMVTSEPGLHRLQLQALQFHGKSHISGDLQLALEESCLWIDLAGHQ